MAKKSQMYAHKVIPAGQSAIISIYPEETPYFWARRIKLRGMTQGSKKHRSFRVGAVTVGGSPQLAINELVPSSKTPGLVSSDLEWVNWATSSSEGLARDLQITVHNPWDLDLDAHAYIEGYAINALDDAKLDLSAEPSDFPGAASMAIGSQRVSASGKNPVGLDVSPSVSNFFRPKRMRITGESLDGSEVDFGYLATFVGENKLDGPVKMKDVLNCGYNGDYTPYSMISDGDGWIDMSDYPAISKEGLGQELSVFVRSLSDEGTYFSVTVQGDALAELPS